MPILKSTGKTLPCSRFVYGKRTSTRAKSVNSFTGMECVQLAGAVARLAWFESGSNSELSKRFVLFRSRLGLRDLRRVVVHGAWNARWKRFGLLLDSGSV
jgi:hypothetical protein